MNKVPAFTKTNRSHQATKSTTRPRKIDEQMTIFSDRDSSSYYEARHVGGNQRSLTNNIDPFKTATNQNDAEETPAFKNKTLSPGGDVFEFSCFFAHRGKSHHT